jgi:hypothetical protein
VNCWTEHLYYIFDWCVILSKIILLMCFGWIFLESWNHVHILFCHRIAANCIAALLFYGLNTNLTSDSFLSVSEPSPHRVRTESDIQNNPLCIRIRIRTSSAPAPHPLKRNGLGYDIAIIRPNPLCFHPYADVRGCARALATSSLSQTLVCYARPC